MERAEDVLPSVHRKATCPYGDGVLLRFPQRLERVCAEFARGFCFCVRELWQVQGTRCGLAMRALSLSREPERGLLLVCVDRGRCTVAICDESSIVEAQWIRNDRRDEHRATHFWQASRLEFGCAPLMHRVCPERHRTGGGPL